MTAAKLRYLIPILLALTLPFAAKAQEEDDDSFGGWHFVEVKHQFGSSPWSAVLYFEHENYQYKRLDCWYLRPGIYCNPLPWLKMGLNYDYLMLPDTYGHRAVADMVGTLKEGNLSASLRFRYLHTWKPKLGTEDDELRTKLTVAYSIPTVHLKPYVAIEVFTGLKQWRRTRHYLACIYDITSFMQVETFYMLTFSKIYPYPQHIVGLGLNFNI